MASTFQVRDNRRGFVWLNNEIIDQYLPKLQATAFVVYAVLARHAANGTQIAFPSQERIATLAGISERAVRSSLANLKGVGLIAWEQRPGDDKKYRHNVYVLLDPAAKSAASSENHRQKTTETAGSQLPTNKTQENKTKTQAIVWLWDRYVSLFGIGDKMKLTDKRKAKALTRLNECLSRCGGDMHKAVTMLLAAMKGLRSSSWHMGENPKNELYIDWETHLFGSEEKTEKWMNKGLPLMAEKIEQARPGGLAEMRARRQA